MSSFHAGRDARWWLALLLFCGASAGAQSPAAEAQQHLRLANEAYELGDYGTYTAELETALNLNPRSLATRHNLAGAYALTGRPDEALTMLRDLADKRVDFGVADDTDFAALRPLDGFRALLDELADATQPAVQSELFYRMDQLDLIPEGIAADADAGRFFFGSMRSGDIYVLDRALGLTKFATVDIGNKRSAIGMTVDGERGLLWAVGTSFDMAEGFADGDPIATSVFGFDLDTGALQKQYDVDGATFGLNDVALGPNGALYASGETLQVLDRERDVLVPLETTPPLFGTNGVAAAAHGRTLFVSSYPVGIAAIDLDTRRARFLSTPDDVSLYGVDGLYWHEGDLIAVQNGVRPWRLVRIELSDDESAVTGVAALEFANREATATTGAIVGERIYYIAGATPPPQAPPHIPANVAPFLGVTVIRSTPLEP